MMWLRRLRDGMDDLPRSAAVREELKREMKRRGVRAMHRELGELDAARAGRVHPHDRARIVRALEVLRLTGGREFRGGSGTAPLEMRAVVFYPRDRGALRERIRVRLEGMFAAGFVGEVRGLVGAWGLGADSAPLRAVGYRQVASFLRGEIESEAECRRLAWHATCQLAKRQMTWLRSWTSAEFVDPFSPGARGAVFEIADSFRREKAL